MLPDTVPLPVAPAYRPVPPVIRHVPLKYVVATHECESKDDRALKVSVTNTEPSSNTQVVVAMRVPSGPAVSVPRTTDPMPAIGPDAATVRGVLGDPTA